MSRGKRNPWVVERQRRILEGRTKGVPYRELADEFGITEATARKDFTRALSTTKREAGEAFVHLYREQLDALYRESWAIATDPNVQHRDRVLAIDKATKVLERLARFVGADRTAAELAEAALAAKASEARGVLGSFAVNLQMAYDSLTPAPTPDTAGTSGTTD